MTILLHCYIFYVLPRIVRLPNHYFSYFFTFFVYFFFLFFFGSFVCAVKESYNDLFRIFLSVPDPIPIEHSLSGLNNVYCDLILKGIQVICHLKWASSRHITVLCKHFVLVKINDVEFYYFFFVACPCPCQKKESLNCIKCNLSVAVTVCVRACVCVVC